MIHGYHLVWGTYGFWLPNDPRGSWSDFVYAWELARFGEATRSLERKDINPRAYEKWRQAAKGALKYPPVTLSGKQALEVARGFEKWVEKSGITVWAFSILPEHVHFVLGRHRFKIESVANLLKGAATRRLTKVGMHPMQKYRSNRSRLPSMWGEGHWKVYLDSESAIENAIRYVEENPAREGKKRQHWPFVESFSGLPQGGWITYL